MKENLCICTAIPQIQIPTKVVIIVSKRESKVPTNTGRLASLALLDSTLLVRGDPDKPYNLSEHLDSHRHHILLYPSDDAQVLTKDYVATLEKPLTLVVPDGNWRQTYKMRKRDVIMAKLPVVKIAPGAATQYKVRKESHPEGLATIEAIARALGVIESPSVQADLESLLNVMVSRTLVSRGVKINEME